MKKLSALLLAFCSSGLLGGAIAGASEPVGSWYVAPMVHAQWPADERSVDDDFTFSLAIGKAVSEHWNVELNLSRGKFDGVAADDLTVNTAGLNALAVFYRESRISSFLLLGAGQIESNREFSDDGSDVYIDTGVGILATLGRSADQSSSLSLRGDVRGRHTIADGERKFVDYMAGIGLQYAFGGRPVAAPVAEPQAAPAPADADADGVADGADRCPDTPAGMAVDANGCERDSDGDGVVDSRDKCPGTPAGTKVDAVGCELDSDGDGVLDSKDRCPNTPRGDKVDAVGCSLTLRLEVLFEHNSDELTTESRTYLDSVAASLEDLPNVTGVIEGHTDSTGSDAYNKALSERRARTVRDYLVGKGVDASRLQAAGLGESQPIADNATEAGRAQNRRVVLRRTDSGAR